MVGTGGVHVRGMDAKDVRDKETLERWLKGRPREDAVAIAHRAAMRVLPLALAARDQLIKDYGDLSLYRVLHTAGAWVACRDKRERLEPVIDLLDRTDAARVVGYGSGSGQALMAFDAALLVLSAIRSKNPTQMAVRSVMVAMSAISSFESTIVEPIGSRIRGSITLYKTDGEELQELGLIQSVRDDCMWIEAGDQTLRDKQLWILDRPIWLAYVEAEAAEITTQLPPMWAFLESMVEFSH